MGRYRELPPRPELRDHLSCVWSRTLGPDEPPQLVRVLPDACVDIVWEAGRAPLVAGPDTGPAPTELSAGSVIVGARFRTGLAPGVLGVPASELRDGRAPLEAVWGRRAVRQLEESDGVDSPGLMLQALQETLVKRLPPATSADRLLPAVMAWAAQPQPATLDGLAHELAVAERTLRRRVEELVGYGPKALHRVLRFQGMLRLTSHADSLADLAAAAGYADQAHMTRECRRLSGLTPAQLLPGWSGDARWREGHAGLPR